MENKTEILTNETKKSGVQKILYIVSFFPLPIYPLILLANMMSLGGQKSENDPLGLTIAVYSFLIFSALYPITFIYSLKNRKKNNLFITSLPLFHIIISVILCAIWANIEN